MKNFTPSLFVCFLLPDGGNLLFFHPHGEGVFFFLLKTSYPTRKSNGVFPKYSFSRFLVCIGNICIYKIRFDLIGCQEIYMSYIDVIHNPVKLISPMKSKHSILEHPIDHVALFEIKIFFTITF